MGMTMTQKILAAHAGLSSVQAGQLIEAARPADRGRPAGRQADMLSGRPKPAAASRATRVRRPAGFSGVVQVTGNAVSAYLFRRSVRCEGLKEGQSWFRKRFHRDDRSLLKGKRPGRQLYHFLKVVHSDEKGMGGGRFLSPGKVSGP